MKRSTASWTTAVAASALLAMPVGSWAQQTTPSNTPRQQTTGAPSQPAGRTPGADMQKGSANEHLRQAQSALADIPAASLTGTAKTRVAELKRHISTLEQAAGQNQAAGAKAPRSTSATAARGASWSTEVAAADRILTELLGAHSTTGAAAPAPAGTSGATAAMPKSTTGSKATAVTLDDTARTKLQEVRTHLTAFATAMSGTGGAAPSSDDPTTSASASPAPEASATGATGTTGAAATTATGTSGLTPGPAQPVAATKAAGAAENPAAPAQSAAPSQSAQPSNAPAQQADADSVKRHLTAARDTLSQLTQLPAAAQLTGDARTQVSQLISNFNELITTNTDWRAAYGKLQGNLTALVGEQRADESAAPVAGTAGAVGTSGTTAIDPAVRAKLVEFRSHLMEFEKAAGGGTNASSTPAAEPADAAAPAPSSTTAATAAPATASSPASASAAPEPTATSGNASQQPAPAGTSGSTAAAAAAGDQQPARPAAAAGHDAKAAEGHKTAMSHIDAIEAILNGMAPAGTSGTTASKTAKPAAGSLDSAKIEQIRTHLQQLRSELSKSGGH